MNLLTAETLARACGVSVNANMRSLVKALDDYGADVGLDRPHRLAHYAAQWMHESGRFRYDREVWGPTDAQKRYEGRADLGNTQPGDGEKFKGRTGAQITGRGNVSRFLTWLRKSGYNPPDFLADPDMMNVDPWEGLGPLWYWAVGNPSGKSLNVLADENNIEMITRRVNGGKNGLDDRLLSYRKIGLVLLGYPPDQLERFQAAAKAGGFYDGDVDNEDGPRTRAAIHLMLVKLDGARSSTSSQVKAAPVSEKVEVVKEVAVVPKAATKGRVNSWLAGVGGFLTANLGSFFTQDLTTKLIILGVSAVAIGFVLWRGDLIVQQVKKISAQLEGE